MWYLVSKEEINALSKRQISPTEICVPDRRVIITWTGEDIRYLVEQTEEMSSDEIAEIIEEVVATSEDFDCSMCIESAVDDAIRKIELQK